MRPTFDLRLRIAAALAATCIAVVGVLGITLYFASLDLEQALIEQLVSEELESLVQRAQEPGARTEVSGLNFNYFVIDTPADRQKLPPELRDLGPGHHGLSGGPNRQHAAVSDIGGRRYIVIYDAGPHEARKERFRDLLLLTLGAAAIAAVLLGHWLAGVLTRQLTQLAARVSQLAPDAALNAPLRRPDHDREVAALAEALDQHHGRILDMMQREQEFTANASHELRTPLTAIRTSCELLAADPNLGDKVRTRIEMIDGAARQMTERMESLLFLARQTLAQEIETVLLRRCVDDVAGPYREEMARKGLEFEVSIAEDAAVRLDRRALQLVLANLIKNAAKYTDRGFVRVSYAAQRLTVADSGPGIAPEQQSLVFVRHYRADDRPEGLGLGLAIVRRICDDLGWRVEVQSRPGAGSSFSVVFG